MSETVLQTIGIESEAGKLQSDLTEVFRKMLSHARTIDTAMTLGDMAEALGRLRELEGYLERGLAILSRQIDGPP